MARLLVPIALLVVVAFVVTLVNQTAQLVALADRAHPLLGDVAFWTLIVGYTFCALVPLYVWIRLPRALRPPESETDPAFEEHVTKLGARLARNPLLAGVPTQSRAEIEAALPVLDSAADAKMKAAARQVFVTTAVSQNGSLDTFVVLAAQSKLILEIARTYYQRPTLRDLTFLYANVAATAFIAGELEDVDLAAQLQPRARGCIRLRGRCSARPRCGQLTLRELGDDRRRERVPHAARRCHHAAVLSRARAA